CDELKMAEISKSAEYQSFRSSVPQRKIVVDDDNSKEWILYDAGPRSVKCPLFCFPPASGTADVFFRQLLALSVAGYRVIAVEYPVYWTMTEFLHGFRRLLDHLQLDRVHIFGASLGGFLAQKFAEFSCRSPRVASIILCNSFYDTAIFNQTSSATTFWMMPALFLKRMVMGNFNKGMMDNGIADSVDFLVEKLDQLSQPELASRLTLNCMSCYVEPQKLSNVTITVIDVFDDCALSTAVKEEMYKCYPSAKRAHLKSGGNFPYLSRSVEVNIFIQIHLQQFLETPYRAKELTDEEQENLNTQDCIVERNSVVGQDSDTLNVYSRLRSQPLLYPVFVDSFPRTRIIVFPHVSPNRLNTNICPHDLFTIAAVTAANNVILKKKISMSQGSCCFCKRQKKVSPSPGIYDGYEIVEIRNKRYLRILHLNPKPRDEKFEKDMQSYLRIKERGCHPMPTMSGPLKMPRRRMSINQNALPEVPADPHSEAQTPVLPGDSTGSPWFSKESSFRNTTPSVGEKTPAAVRSASGVQVAVNHKMSGTAPAENGTVPNLENPIPRELTDQDLKLQENLTELHDQHDSCSIQDLVLFFLHGVGGSSDIWKPQLNYFSSLGYEIVAPDLIGHGLSSAPRNQSAYHFDEILADLTAVFDKNCNRKNVIIAHSYGCSFAAVLGRHRSRRVTKLVLISGGSPTPLCPQPGVFTLPLCMLACLRPCVQCRYKKGALNSTKEPAIPPEEAFAIPTYVLQHTMNGQIWPEGDEFFHNWLMCPALLIYGLRDQLISLEEEKDMEEAIYDSHLEVIEDASHMVMIEVPDKVNDLIHTFLQHGLNTELTLSPKHEPTERRYSCISQQSMKSAKSGGKTMR
ncbi:uncharacterized protein LOC121380927, partial [Gigantopelta aegis]|uniref:uncharacterized protein LOC121380927 n=1 Tax=Gigantopelta aegis TaxID=1735272 RepID=UPI001B88BBEC